MEPKKWVKVSTSTTGDALIITDGDSVPDGTNDSEKENRPKVVEKQSIRHKITGIKNNRRQHVEKEGRRCQRRDAGAIRMEEK